ncbi:MAG: hypothetical protein RL685_147 [Pseudomonadota bacterium]|jgi:hypothetical protein
MKYLLPLVMFAAAAWATQSDPRSSFARADSLAREASRGQENVPWLSEAFAAQMAAAGGIDPHVDLYGDGDPHAGLYSDGDPHAGSYSDDPHAGLDLGGESVGMCPHDASGMALADGEYAGLSAEEDPHTGARTATPAVALPAQGVPRSGAQNGHTIAELHERRGALAEQTVRVRGLVVKRTDGILGETYLHLQDGSGSPERENHDLTVTTTEEFAIGDTVEVQGQVQIDRDLGLGYQYAVMLTSATHAALN